MVENMSGSYLDFIIHPGETLKEIITDRSITVTDLARRTGMSRKHLTEVINGKADISSNLAVKLEYTLGIKSIFWNNLQAQYNDELQLFAEKQAISEQEYEIISQYQKANVISVFESKGIIKPNLGKVDLVLELRKFMKVANLTIIPTLSFAGAFRTQTSTNINVFVMYAWMMLCENLTQNISVKDYNIELLKENIPEIKKCMFLEPNAMYKKLVEIFSACGIAFAIVPNFKGAPVQGMIKDDNGKISMCLTIRQKYLDIFWFTLFHEIGHLVNNDFNRVFVDFNNVDSDIERNADKFASETLIKKENYLRYTKGKNFSPLSIKRFADQEKVDPSIVAGRLMKDEYISWGSIPRTKYEWA